MSIETGNGGMKKVFEYFPEMANEIKLMMVKEMELRDRYRFSRCSKSSRNFWEKITRNQPCSISVHFRKTSITYEVHHGDYKKFGQREGGFLMVFENKTLRYVQLPSYTQLWNIKVDKSNDIIELGIDYVKKGLEFYQNGIKELDINGSYTKKRLRNLDSIENFKNLETLCVSKDAEILDLVLSKLRNPLKKLNVPRINNRRNHKICDKLFQVQDEINCFHIDFNYQELLQLSAKHVHIKIGKLTEQDIFNFIKSWENGTYKGRIERCEWCLLDSTFNQVLLCQLFQIEHSEYSNSTVNFVQKGSGKMATLRVGFFMQVFTINSQ